MSQETFNQFIEQVAALTKQVSNLVYNSKQKYRSRSISRPRCNNKNYSNQNINVTKIIIIIIAVVIVGITRNLVKHPEIVDQAVLSIRKTRKKFISGG